MESEKMKCKECGNKIGFMRSLLDLDLCVNCQIIFDRKIRYVVYVGGTPMYFNTRKERDVYWNKIKKTKKYLYDGNQNRDNYKSYIWKRVFKGHSILE